MTREHLKLPANAEFSMGARLHGRFYAAIVLAAIPDFPALVVSEITNYHYVGDGEIEENGMTPIEWAEAVVRDFRSFAGKDARCSAWVDPETNYDPDIRRRSKFYIKPNTKFQSPELRTSALREYFQENRVQLMPWLKVLPYEIGRARWPDEAAKAFQLRAVDHDYALSALEQAISRRPKGTHAVAHQATNLLDRIRQERNISARKYDPHLGGM